MEISVETDTHGWVEVEVLHYAEIPPYHGSAWNCESDWDFYGSTELEYNILTPDVEDCKEIEMAVLDYLREE